MSAYADAVATMIVRSSKDLGAAVKARRKALALDQGSLAAKVGVSRQWIGALEQGKAGAELALVLRTLRALDMPLSIGDPLVAREGDGDSVDIDAIVARARQGG
ncbi:MAG: helix-turn-helix domain-containing protein [Brevundimonas sp.]|uniref:helix-turn-helix domain-containing protein n=1 Tax=Brevundimonas sp. TaxID=1871086 RepID=UPI00271C15F6|nr:helix-turn-helix domain-containing protein [Brevundimonas sp.]MDO9589026.1 helix-turn-helix domain-containing protein [Brevundimonas sp.]